MEILRADIGDFIKIAVHLGTSISMLGEKDIWGDEEHLAMLELSLEELRGICQDGELPVTQKLVDDILTTFKLVRNSGNETVKSL